MKSESTSKLWDNFQRPNIHLIGGPEEDMTGGTEMVDFFFFKRWKSTDA